MFHLQSSTDSVGICAIAGQVEDLNPWEARAVYFERLIFFTIFVTVMAAIMETVEGFDPPGSVNRQADPRSLGSCDIFQPHRITS